MVQAETLQPEQFAAAVRFNEDGLAPVIVQDATTCEVLMMAWMDREALRRTQAMGEMVFWSRSRQTYWHKGATSGHVQRLVELRVDCDGDTLLARVAPAGPACHTGALSCFFRALAAGDPAAAGPS
jgi:phosphoribosyl-AMP cyclohydrolase